MPFAAALSTAAKTDQALNEVCARALGTLPAPPDLALVFLSPHHAEEAETIAATAAEQLAATCLLGCVGEAIAGNGKEIEHKPALSLWLAKWARPVDMEPFALELEQTPDGYSLMGWPDGMVTADAKTSVVLLLGDPSTFPADLFLQQVNDDYAGLRVVGGMASGMRREGDCRLIFNGRVRPSGAVGVLLQG